MIQEHIQGMSGRITAMKVQEHNTQRVNVFLEGEFAFGLSRITAAWLRLGQELSDEKIEELQNQDAGEVAYQKALQLLDRRPRAEAEIRRSLAKHEMPETVIDAVLERLRRSGLVNDEQFAKAWVENRTEFRPRSRRALAVEMRQHGLSRETIEQTLSETDLDEEALAYQAGMKQIKKLSQLEWLDFRRKLSAFLARRGFGYDVIAPVVQRIWNETQSEHEEED